MRGCFGGKRRRSGVGDRNHCDRAPYQVGDERRKLVKTIVCKAVLDRNILALHIAGFGEAPVERGDIIDRIAARPAAEIANYWNRLLRGRRYYRIQRRAPEPRDELSPYHLDPSRRSAKPTARAAAREWGHPLCLLHRMSLDMPSRPGEFHPEPLTEPYVNLSIHTARGLCHVGWACR
jgi:hypothetical protein